MVALLTMVAAPTPALATTAADPVTTPLVATIFGDIAHTVLGGVDWTVDVAGDFILNLFGGIVKKLIPRSWIQEGTSILAWLVACSGLHRQDHHPHR